MDGPQGHYAKWNKSDREKQKKIFELVSYCLWLLMILKWMVIFKNDYWALIKNPYTILYYHNLILSSNSSMR